MSAPPTTNEALIRLLDSGKRYKYLYFWGHRPRPDGTLGASCLSQWWPARFELDGVGFPSAEHYMMWSKARLFGDDDAAGRVLVAKSPAEAKNVGRTVKGYDDDTWARERFAIVVAASRAKFDSTDELRGFLLGTGDRVLVEASPLDRVWGIGLAADDEAVQDPRRWRGLNLLGYALMQARHELGGRA
ncbi:NADAR family protein [Dactylosporangium sp. CS-047395]|uniref:NADAR family protein n=1 Tax=Dactylosporangium sp. CS-047395 TaxID=3239936 RepID=UPI003D903CDD